MLLCCWTPCERVLFCFFLISYTPYLVGRVFCSRFWVCVCERVKERHRILTKRTYSLNWLFVFLLGLLVSVFVFRIRIFCNMFEFEVHVMISPVRKNTKTKINKLIQRKHAQTRIHTWTCILKYVHWVLNYESM